ncbi:hypothetical protein [Pseudactinotalea terrae]|nr:hypothetical protein [Pseudactinotalea terrae]
MPECTCIYYAAGPVRSALVARTGSDREDEPGCPEHGAESGGTQHG